MTTKNELLFLKSERFGKLNYHNVYNFYDEPLFFTALNEFQQPFLCYSLGFIEDKDTWLIKPISSGDVLKLEQKQLSIYGALVSSASSKIVVTERCFETLNSVNENFKVASKLPYEMPIETRYIRESVNWDGKREYSHKVRFSRRNNLPITEEVLGKASQAFGSFIKNFLKQFDVRPKFLPIDAVPGSFIYRVKAEGADDLQTKGYAAISQLSQIGSFKDVLDTKDIDLRTLRRLLDILAYEGVQVDFIDATSMENILSLNEDIAENYITEVDDRLGSYLDSTMVPQANDLNKLRKYLQLIEDYGHVTPANLGVDKRNVAYYRDACSELSLTHSYSKLTPIGTKALTAQTENEFMLIIQRQFEETECGSIWMHNQNVTSMLDIDEKSASEFLINSCKGLNEGTSKRRASTLKTWVKKFKEANENIKKNNLKK